MSSSEPKRHSPYQGLIPYTEQDALFFFGREKETRLITANLFASSLTLLYGASGVGKSSVLRAGVAYSLSDRKDLLVIVFNSWQGHAVSDLKQTIASQIERADSAAWNKAAHLLDKGPNASLAEFLSVCASQLNRRLMIILDQFEEYFLYHPEEDEFASEFPKAVTQTEAPVSFLISLREDFYAKLDRFEGSIPALYDNYLRIEHLDREAARAAIEKPVAEYNRLYVTDGKPFILEPELIEAVLEQVETGRVIIGESGRGVVEAAREQKESEARIETPYLQLVMERLWDEETRAGSHTLQKATLDSLGGAESIVRTHLNAVMDALPPEEQNSASRIFHYLVTPSGTKIAYTASDLAGSAELNQTEVDHLLKKLSLSGVRVLRTLDPPLTQRTAPRYEIFHDVLAPAILTWRANYVQAQERAEADRKAAEQQRQAEEQARIQEQAKAAGRLRRLVMALALVSLVAAGIAVYAIKLRNEARANERNAESARQLAEKETRRAITAKEEALTQGGRADQQAQLALDEAAKAVKAKAEAQIQRKRAEAQAQLAAQRATEAQKERDIARDAVKKAEQARLDEQKQREIANEGIGAFRELSVAVSEILFALKVDLEGTDDAKKRVATKKLQNIIAGLEKDKNISAILKSVGVSSQDTDGVKLRAALIDIRRTASIANNIDLLEKINSAIVALGDTEERRLSITYSADAFDSLQRLELLCEIYEANQLAEITSLELGIVRKVKVTLVRSKKSDNFTGIGHLILTQYTTDVDEQSQRAIHLSEGELFLFKGEAYINNRAVKVLAFRGR